jgi:transcriptional regulator with XRE-family HTH domain
MIENIKFGKRLKTIREHLGFRQNQFAEKLDISNTALSELESDKYPPNLRLIIKIASDFDVNLDYLIFERGEMFEHESGKKALKIIEDSIFDHEGFLKFLHDLKRSPLLQYAIMSHYRLMLGKEGDVIRGEFREYEENLKDGEKEPETG